MSKYLPTPADLIRLNACGDNPQNWADAFFGSNIDSTEQVEWTAARVKQACADFDVAWAYKAGLRMPRDLALSDAHCAYYYALHVDKGARDDTRAAVLGSARYAYRYARYVDKGPRDDTRAAVLSDAHCAYYYALRVDKRARDDTRAAVLGDACYVTHKDGWIVIR